MAQTSFLRSPSVLAALAPAVAMLPGASQEARFRAALAARPVRVPVHVPVAAPVAAPVAVAPEVKAESKPAAKSLRTFYLTADGRVTKEKPESFVKTCRAANAVEARALLAA